MLSRDYISLTTSSHGNYLNASLTCDSNLNVTCTVYTDSLEWRLKERGYEGNTGLIHGPSNATSETFTFKATDGGEYVFQCMDSLTYTYEGAFSSHGFTVSSGDDSGGDDSGDDGGDDDGGDSGGSTSVSKTVYAYIGPGCSLTVKINGAIIKPSSFLSYNYGHSVYFTVSNFDELEIEASALNGYMIDTYTSSAGTFNYNVEGLEYNLNNQTWSLDIYDDSREINVSATPIDSSDDNDDINSNSYLLIVQDMYTKVKVSRTKTSSSGYGAYLGELTNGKQSVFNDYICYSYPIWEDDYFNIQTESIDGYTLDSIEYFYLYEASTGEMYYSTSDYNARIIALSKYWGQTTRSEVFYIDSGSGFNKYEMYIDNGTSWDLVVGADIQRVSGTVSGSSTLYKYTDVSCGFKPDLVSFDIGESNQGHKLSSSAAFEVFDTTSVGLSLSRTGTGRIPVTIALIQTEDGFSYMAFQEDSDGNHYVFDGEVNYVAVKYT